MSRGILTISTDGKFGAIYDVCYIEHEEERVITRRFHNVIAVKGSRKYEDEISWIIKDLESTIKADDVILANRDQFFLFRDVLAKNSGKLQRKSLWVPRVDFFCDTEDSSYNTKNLFEYTLRMSINSMCPYGTHRRQHLAFNDEGVYQEFNGETDRIDKAIIKICNELHLICSFDDRYAYIHTIAGKFKFNRYGRPLVLRKATNLGDIVISANAYAPVMAIQEVIKYTDYLDLDLVEKIREVRCG